MNCLTLFGIHYVTFLFFYTLHNVLLKQKKLYFVFYTIVRNNKQRFGISYTMSYLKAYYEIIDDSLPYSVHRRIA